jgi:hypothetical protein
LNLDAHEAVCRRATTVRADRSSPGFAGHRNCSGLLEKLLPIKSQIETTNTPFAPSVYLKIEI